MTELHDRFLALDLIAPPDLWGEASRRAEGTSASATVTRPTAGGIRLTPARRRSSGRSTSPRRISLLVAAALLIVVAVGAAIVVGTAMLAPRPTSLIPPERGEFTPTGTPSGALLNHRATLLKDGRVLLTHFDTAEVWDPETGALSTAGSMPETHEAASATRLQDGRVLVAGGYWYGYSDGPGVAAWLWDPATASFSPTGPLTPARASLNASRYLKRGESGETIEVTDRGRLVARIVPVTRAGLQGLIAEGRASLPTRDALDVEPIRLAPGSGEPSQLVNRMRDESQLTHADPIHSHGAAALHRTGPPPLL